MIAPRCASIECLKKCVRASCFETRKAQIEIAVPRKHALVTDFNCLSLRRCVVFWGQCLSPTNVPVQVAQPMVQKAKFTMVFHCTARPFVSRLIDPIHGHIRIPDRCIEVIYLRVWDWLFFQSFHAICGLETWTLSQNWSVTSTIVSYCLFSFDIIIFFNVQVCYVAINVQLCWLTGVLCSLWIPQSFKDFAI